MEDFCFEEDTHTYSENGVIYPSVTDTLKAAKLICFDMINPDVLERKRRIGTLVHEATQLWDEDDLDWETLPDPVKPYVSAYAVFRNDVGGRLSIDMREEPRLVEAHGMKYGMTPDFVGALDEIPTILELKCCAAVHPSWGVQLAGYELGFPKISGGYQRIALQLKPDGTYRLTPPYKDSADVNTFLSSLVVTNWKRNNKITY